MLSPLRQSSCAQILVGAGGMAVRRRAIAVMGVGARMVCTAKRANDTKIRPRDKVEAERRQMARTLLADAARTHHNAAAIKRHHEAGTGRGGTHH